PCSRHAAHRSGYARLVGTPARRRERRNHRGAAGSGPRRRLRGRGTGKRRATDGGMAGQSHNQCFNPRDTRGPGAQSAALVRKGEPPLPRRSRALGDHRYRLGCVAKAVISSGQIIHQRRSLLACDGSTSISGERLYRMLGRIMPRAERPAAQRPMPWDAIPWAPAIHLGLFVHRVDGVEPGLYALARDPAKVETLKGAMHAHFSWETPPGCRPDIAGDGAFSLGMLAAYQATLVEHGPSFYRRLFWEAGLVGQVLYLEAEAAGVRSTGIGCFFDNPVHQVFGFRDLEFQSLYHFTVGGAVDDPRLTTLPPYRRDRS